MKRERRDERATMVLDADDGDINSPEGCHAGPWVCFGAEVEENMRDGVLDKSSG